MIRQLVAVKEGLALVIDRPILDLLRIAENTRLDISTDGKRLIVEPVLETAVRIAIQARDAPTAPEVSAPLAPAAEPFRNDSRLSEPFATVEIVDELTGRYGMSNEQFRELHHARNYLNTIQAHRSYCARPSGGPFRMGGTNFRTALRLLRALESLRVGKSWSESIARALTEIPK